MMVGIDCEQLVTDYLAWLRENIFVTEIGEVCEITTPFLDRHNDFLQIYVWQKDGQYFLSDDGYIMSDLRMSGVDFNTENRKQTLDTVLAGFGVQRVDHSLQVRASRANLPQRKHSLIQAMLSVNDLFLLAQPRVASYFREDVEQFLRSHQVRFIEMVNFAGRSGFVHSFDFAIPASIQQPERLLKTINNPSRDNVSSLIFAWNDVRVTRPTDSETKVFAVLNDSERNVSADTLNALESYQITPLQWSKRQQYIELLAA